MTDQEFAEISRRVKAGALYEEQIVGDDAPALIVEIGRLRAALAYACTIIEQYEMDARAVQDRMPGYCQGSIYRGAMARVEALRKGAP